MSVLYLLPAVLLFFSCCSTETTLEKPHGNSAATAVYNEAYQENYEADSLTFIQANAENAYVLMDPFNEDFLTVSELQDLKSKGNELAAYISIGTGEDWRSDFDEIKPYLSDRQWGEWAGEYYVSNIEEGLVDIMKNRIDAAAQLGFDWLEFDNMDWMFNEETRDEYGLVSGESEALAYIEELRVYAVEKGLKCMSKNWRRGAENYDAVTFESGSENFDWWNSQDMQDFLDEGKTVIIVHYNEKNREDAYKAYNSYMDLYGKGISFICETKSEKGYIHFNN